MKTFLLLCCTLLASAAVAADTPAPIATVQRFLEAFNKGDLKAAEATHAAEVAITDEFPPFHWRGREGFKAWLADLTEHDAASGITDGHMKIGDTIREETSGDGAYVVLATEYTFKQNGTPMREPAQMTFALKKEKTGWRIVGWTFAGPKPTP
jgi:ketosteroid isomerase-like protein